MTVHSFSIKAINRQFLKNQTIPGKIFAIIMNTGIATLFKIVLLNANKLYDS